MRAVNLIPSDQRSGTPVGAGRSQGAAYAVLALLAGFAVLAVLYGKANRAVADHKKEAASLTAKAQRASAQATALAPYTTFATLRDQRAQAVQALVDSRFDWAHAFHEFGRVLTGQTSISSLEGSIASATVASTTTSAPAAGAAAATPASSAGASPTASTATSATPPGSVPTFTLSGCATSQSVVAQTLQRLRLIDGVKEVSLQSSTKGSPAAGGSGGCPGGDPVFSITVTFEPLPSTASSATSKSSSQSVSNGSATPGTGTGGKAG
jgi:hypothetical protein